MNKEIFQTAHWNTVNITNFHWTFFLSILYVQPMDLPNNYLTPSLKFNQFYYWILFNHLQKKVEEFSDDEDRSKRVVTETKETVTRTSGSTPAEKSKWKNPMRKAFKQLTASDYPTIIIFLCITVITLSFVLEPYIK